MSAIYVLWLRELKRYLRSRVQIIGSLAQPAFYLLALGFGFNYVFEKAGQGSYMQFMAPGMIGMTVLLSAIFSGVTMLWDRQFGVLKAALVSPVPRLSIMLGRTLGGATVGVFQGVLILLLCMLAGFRPQHWFAVVSAFGFVAAISLSFAALGTMIGSAVKDMQSFQVIGNFMVMPMVFLSGALYPLSHQPKVLTIITTLNPLSYGVDGLRGTLIGSWHFSYLLDMGLLTCLGTLFLVLGAWFFSRLEI
jgi:ABC-2 type transport system permease protein